LRPTAVRAERRAAAGATARRRQNQSQPGIRRDGGSPIKRSPAFKQWLARFNGVAAKNLPNYLGWRRALEAWGDHATPQNWIKSAIGNIGNGPYQQLTL